MTQRQLLVFGDSWPAAVKIPDKNQSFPNLIAQQCNYDLIDLSEPATSIEHVAMALVNFLETAHNPDHDYTALFCLTDPSRNMVYEPNVDVIPKAEEFWAPSCYTRELQIQNDRDISKLYFRHIHSHRYELYCYYKNLIFLKSLCQIFQIDAFFVNNFNHQKLSFRLLHDVKIYKQTLREICRNVNYSELDSNADELIYRKNLYIGPDGHPTTQGHRLIADTLSKWIKHE